MDPIKEVSKEEATVPQKMCFLKTKLQMEKIILIICLHVVRQEAYQF